MHGRHLIAQRLAAARGHEDEGVTAVDQGLDDRLLQRAEGVKAEDPLQGFDGQLGGVVHEGMIPGEGLCRMSERTPDFDCGAAPAVPGVQGEKFASNQTTLRYY